MENNVAHVPDGCFSLYVQYCAETKPPPTEHSTVLECTFWLLSLSRCVSWFLVDVFLCCVGNTLNRRPAETPSDHSIPHIKHKEKNSQHYLSIIMQENTTASTTIYHLITSKLIFDISVTIFSQETFGHVRCYKRRNIDIYMIDICTWWHWTAGGRSQTGENFPSSLLVVAIQLTWQIFFYQSFEVLSDCKLLPLHLLPVCLTACTVSDA